MWRILLFSEERRIDISKTLHPSPQCFLKSFRTWNTLAWRLATCELHCRRLVTFATFYLKVKEKLMTLSSLTSMHRSAFLPSTLSLPVLRKYSLDIIIYYIYYRNIYPCLMLMILLKDVFKNIIFHFLVYYYIDRCIY